MYPVRAVVVSTHREGCNVDEPTTQGVGKLPLEFYVRSRGCMDLGAGALEREQH